MFEPLRMGSHTGMRVDTEGIDSLYFFSLF